MAIFGISGTDIEPRDDFEAWQDPTGKWRGRQSFTMLSDVYEQQNAGGTIFYKGRPITELCPNMPVENVYLVIDYHRRSDLGGGWIQVSCELLGFNEFEFTTTERETVYTLTGTRLERSILEHPVFKFEVQLKADIQVFAEAYKTGRWIEADVQTGSVTSPPAEIILTDSTSYATGSHTITDADTVLWWIIIFRNGIRTYFEPTLEWSKETSNKGGLTDAELAKLGMLDAPPGNPPTPEDGKYNWMKVAISETRQAGATSTSEVWQLSPGGGFQQNSTISNKIYNYNRAGLPTAPVPS